MCFRASDCIHTRCRLENSKFSSVLRAICVLKDGVLKCFVGLLLYYSPCMLLSVVSRGDHNDQPIYNTRREDLELLADLTEEPVVGEATGVTAITGTATGAAV